MRSLLTGLVACPFAACVALAGGVAHAEPARPIARPLSAASDDTNDGTDEEQTKGEEDKPSKSDSTTSGMLNLLALRGQSTTVHGSNQDSSGLGFSVGSEAEGTVSYGYFHLHLNYAAYLGGGASGVDGTLRANLLAGVRVPVTDHVGPYVRLGAGGEYRGNDAFLYSHLDLPEAQMGLTAVYDYVSFEGGVQGGITLGGRYDTGQDQRRSLDGAPMGGAYAAAHVYPILLRGEYRTYAQSHDAPSPEEWRAEACAAFPSFKDGTASPFLFCFDGTWLHGAGTPPGQSVATDSRVSYMGLSVGFGAIESKQKKARRDHPSDDTNDQDKKDKPAPDSPIAKDVAKDTAPAGALDADDTRRLAQEAMSYFGGSRTMSEWLAASPRPVVVVLPFANRMTEPLAEAVLESPRREAEAWLLRSQAVVVLDRPAAERALAGRSLDDPSDVARAANARYALTGLIERHPAPGGDKTHAVYALTLRLVDASTNAVVWQRESTLTKITQRSR